MLAAETSHRTDTAVTRYTSKTAATVTKDGKHK